MKWQKPLDEAATCLCTAYPRIEEACVWLGKAAKRADGTPEGYASDKDDDSDDKDNGEPDSNEQ